MCKGLFAAVTLLDIDAHQLSNEILRGITDVVPIW